VQRENKGLDVKINDLFAKTEVEEKKLEPLPSGTLEKSQTTVIASEAKQSHFYMTE
jgi:hypothetical protein